MTPTLTLIRWDRGSIESFGVLGDGKPNTVPVMLELDVLPKGTQDAIAAAHDAAVTSALAPETTAAKLGALADLDVQIAGKRAELERITAQVAAATPALATAEASPTKTP